MTKPRDNSDLVGKTYFSDWMEFTILRVADNPRNLIVRNETGGFDCEIDGKTIRLILRGQGYEG
jgi:hypothetical protein